MNKLTVSAVAFAAAFTCTTALAENEAPTGIETNSTIRLPKLEAEIGYSNMKIERGAIENPESVFVYGLELEWYGVFGGFEACHDLTDINDRRGRYNEIESFLGYGHRFGDLTVKAAYVYKACVLEESDTQEVHFEFEYETPWVTPYLELELDAYRRPGALYGAFGLEREWEFYDWLSATVYGEIGFGNRYRNDEDFELDRGALRQMMVGGEFEIELCPHVKLVPSISFYDYFTDAQRSMYDKFNGFACVVGCALEMEF